MERVLSSCRTIHGIHWDTYSFDIHSCHMASLGIPRTLDSWHSAYGSTDGFTLYPYVPIGKHMLKIRIFNLICRQAYSILKVGVFLYFRLLNNSLKHWQAVAI